MVPSCYTNKKLLMTNRYPLPSNKKIGIFFFIILTILSVVLFIYDYPLISVITLTTGLISLTLSYLKPDLLLPVNKAWMTLGYLLGYIVSPIVIGSIFFVIFTPISIFLKIIGRDELKLLNKNSDSYWRKRQLNKDSQTSFKNQF